MDNAISKINKFFDDNRDDYIKAKARMQAELKKDPKMNRDLQAKYNKVIGLIDTCEDQYKKMQTFVNPFPRAKPSNTPTPDPDSDSDIDMEDVQGTDSASSSLPRRAVIASFPLRIISGFAK